MDLERFRKVLGMLGSDQDGERSAAALRASAMLKEAGVSWNDVMVKGAIGPEQASSSDVLMKALMEVQSLKDALAAENIRNRILASRLEAITTQHAIDARAKAVDEIVQAEAHGIRKAPGIFGRYGRSSRS